MGAGTNSIRNRMLAGQVALGVALHLRDPAVVELIGLGGLDAVFIDMENSGLELGSVEELIRAAEVVSIAPVVRIPTLDAVLIRRVLDLGAQAIAIPHVQSMEDAEQAVRATRYRPLGERGVSLVSRAARYGSVSWPVHTRAANDDVVLSLMIEDRRGLENLESIASVKGVDLIAVGPSDLSESLGITEPNDPRLRSEVQDIAQKLKRIGNAKMAFPYGNPMLAIRPNDLRDWGVSYSNVGPPIERLLLHHFQEKVAEVRAGIENTSA